MSSGHEEERCGKNEGTGPGLVCYPRGRQDTWVTTVLSRWFQAEEAGCLGPPSKKFSACWSEKLGVVWEAGKMKGVAGVSPGESKRRAVC